MIKTLKTIFCISLSFLLSTEAFALVEMKNDKNTLSKELKVTSFIDYPPFGYIKNPHNRTTFTTIFQEFLDDYVKENYFTPEYVVNKNYETLIRDVRRGEIDILLGMYFETKIYNSLEIIYPSVINNPMTVIMLPSRIGEIKSTIDLKKLKGGFNKSEHISDYAKNQMSLYQITEFTNSNDMYEKLFTGEIDFVFTSYYFGIFETSRLGLRNQVSFSKQTLWDMPLFIGVSKTSRYRKLLVKTLTRMSENPETKKKMNDHLIKTINEIENANRGIVPPAYTKQPQKQNM